MTRFRLAAGTVALFVGAFFVSESALAQSAEEEVARQTARLISEAIGSRIGEDVEAVTAAPAEEAAGAAPEEMPNTVWGSLTYNRVDFDDADGGVDIFLTSVGYDRRFGSFIPGVSLTGSFATPDDIAGVDGGDLNSATLSPYLAYIINEYLFVNGLVGLSLGTFDNPVGDADLLGVFTQEEINGVLAEGNWRFNGKVGHRFSYSEIDPDAGPSTDSTSHTVVAGAKVGHRFDMVTPYVGTQYEHLIPDEGDDDDFLYFFVGFKMDVVEEFDMDLSGQAEVINDTTDSYKVTWQGRYRF